MVPFFPAYRCAPQRASLGIVSLGCLGKRYLLLSPHISSALDTCSCSFRDQLVPAMQHCLFHSLEAVEGLFKNQQRLLLHAAVSLLLCSLSCDLSSPDSCYN